MTTACSPTATAATRQARVAIDLPSTRERSATGRLSSLCCPATTTTSPSDSGDRHLRAQGLARVVIWATSCRLTIQVQEALLARTEPGAHGVFRGNPSHGAGRGLRGRRSRPTSRRSSRSRRPWLPFDIHAPRKLGGGYTTLAFTLIPTHPSGMFDYVGWDPLTTALS